MSSNIRLTVALREGVVSGLVQNRRALKGGATLALIAILAALTALLLIILIALAFICRHKKVKIISQEKMKHFERHYRI